MIAWIKIFQMNLIDKEILKKRKKFLELEQNDILLFEEGIKVIKKIKKEFLSLNFNKTPSVENDRIKYLDNKEAKRAKHLSKISLFQHLENVEKVIDENLDIKNPNDYINLKILALLHDAGKSKELRKKYNIKDNVSHEKASYLYANKILKDTYFEHLSKDLDEKNKDNSYYFNFLARADKIAREKELKKLEQQGEKNF